MWNADLYNRFEKERMQPSSDLAARIEIKDCRRALDVGCGSGMSTLCLKRRFPSAEILGADFSQEMLSKARALLPDTQFILRDCSKPLSDLGKFDVVFSNAFLQWLENQDEFVAHTKELLNEGGVLAMQIPLFAEMEISKIIECSARRFSLKLGEKNLFDGMCVAKNFSAENYYEIFSKNFSRVEMWQTNYFHQMRSSDEIVDFVRGTALLPYLERLDEAQSAEFLRMLKTETAAHYKPCANGTVLFPFYRVFFLAKDSAK